MEWKVEDGVAIFKSVDYKITVSMELDRLGFEHLSVDCDDSSRNYTHGSYTTASIPWEIIEEVKKTFYQKRLRDSNNYLNP